MENKKEEIKSYLTNNVNTFVQSMVYDIVKKRPIDPPAHALKWLTDYIAQRQPVDAECT